MEPLNLMVSLSHFAQPRPDNKHGLSRRAGRRREQEGHAPEITHRWWRVRFRRVARIAAR